MADDLRREQVQRIAALTLAERLQLALELGDADVALLAAAQGVSRDEVSTHERSVVSPTAERS